MAVLLDVLVRAISSTTSDSKQILGEAETKLRKLGSRALSTREGIPICCVGAGGEPV